MPAVTSVSSDLLLRRMGEVTVEHGRQLVGLSQRDVWEQCTDAARTAAKQRVTEASSRSQNLLRAYCRARQAMEELEAMASRYGILPKAIEPPPEASPSTVLAAPCEEMTEPPPRCLALVPSRRPRLGRTTTALPLSPAERQRKTADGHFLQPDSLAVRRDLSSDTEFSDWRVLVAWLRLDLCRRLSSLVRNALWQVPLVVHGLCLLAFLILVYLCSRPQLWVQLLVALIGHIGKFCMCRGSEFFFELNKLLLQQLPLANLSPAPSMMSLGTANPDIASVVQAAAAAAEQSGASDTFGPLDVRGAAMQGAAFAIAAYDDSRGGSEPPPGAALLGLTALGVWMCSKVGRFAA